MSPKRILILYYSQTFQTENALKVIADQLAGKGHSVGMYRLTPVRDFKFPWPVWTMLVMCVKSYLGGLRPVELNPLPAEALEGHFDLVLCGYQPWFLAPSLPMNCFLDGPMSVVLQNQKIASVITCRQLWKRTYRIFKTKVEAKGATIVESLVISDGSIQPYNMVSTVYYLLTGKDIKLFPRLFMPFGIGAPGLEQARLFAERLAARIEQGEI